MFWQLEMLYKLMGNGCRCNPGWQLLSRLLITRVSIGKGAQEDYRWHATGKQIPGAAAVSATPTIHSSSQHSGTASEVASRKQQEACGNKSCKSKPLSWHSRSGHRRLNTVDLVNRKQMHMQCYSYWQLQSTELCVRTYV